MIRMSNASVAHCSWVIEMKELTVVILLSAVILLFGPVMGTIISYLLLIGLFAAIGYMVVRMIIRGVKTIRRNTKQAH